VTWLSPLILVIRDLMRCMSRKVYFVHPCCYVQVMFNVQRMLTNANLVIPASHCPCSSAHLPPFPQFPCMLHRKCSSSRVCSFQSFKVYSSASLAASRAHSVHVNCNDHFKISQPCKCDNHISETPKPYWKSATICS